MCKLFSHPSIRCLTFLNFLFDRNVQWKLRDKFEIMYKKTPVVEMLHRGHTYKYQGDLYDQEALIEFAIDLFHDSDVKKQVPKMPTFFEELRDVFQYSTAHKGGLLSAMLMRNDEGEIYYSAIFGVYVLPVLICWGFYKLMQLPYNGDEETVAKTKLLQAKNEAERVKIENWIKKHPTLRHKYRKWA